MVALQVEDVRAFMAGFLTEEIFDNFLVSEIEIRTAFTTKIEGNRNQSWYDEGEIPDDAPREVTWREVRPFALKLISGKKTPGSIKAVFKLSDANVQRIMEHGGVTVDPDQVGGLFLNIRYENKKLTLITGVSMKGFTLDRTLEGRWDEDMKQFLRHYKIAVTQL